MKHLRTALGGLVLAISALVLFAGCNPVGELTPLNVQLSEGTAKFTTSTSMGISTQALDLTTVTGVFIAFDAIGFVPAQDATVAGIQTIDLDGTVTVDLLAYTDAAYTLADVDVPSTSYEQIRLMIVMDGACFRTDDPSTWPDGAEDWDASLICDTADADVTPITIPSALQTGLKLALSPALDLGSGVESHVLLEFDASASIVEAGATGEYLLKPVVQTCEVADAEASSCS